MPTAMMRSVPVWVAAAWWGSLSTVAFFVVPMLFAYLPSPAMAGGVAARLFSAQTAISVVCGLVLLMVLRSDKRLVTLEVARSASVFVMGGVLLALLVEFGVSPKIIARDNMALWHRIGVGMYVVQWLCASVVFAKLIGRER